MAAGSPSPAMIQSAKKVFLDLKLHDIAATVSRAGREICRGALEDFLSLV